MRKAIVVAAALLALGATQAVAQFTIPNFTIPVVTGFRSPMFYDPYLVLPGAKGGLGITAGIESMDMGEIADLTDLYVMGKYGITDQVEIGARITTGFLNEWRDSFSDLVIGAKYGLSTASAATANVSVFNEAEEIGISAGYMQAFQAGGVSVNSHVQVGLLDGYAPEGVALDLYVEPKFQFSDQLTGYLDVLLKTNTDSIGDNLALDLRPNVDYIVSEALIVNAGVTVGLAGDMKQDEVGIRAAAIYLLPIQ